MKKTLYKIRPKKDLSKLAGKFFVIDVETDGLQATPDKFIFGCMVGENYRKVFHSIDEIKQELEKKIFRHKYIFAHNAEFDFSVIYENIKKKLDKKAVFNGGGFVLAKHGLTYFADSYKIFPTSVAAIGKSIGLEKLDLHVKFKEGSARKKKITQKDIDYCYRDCDIIYQALLKMFNTVGSIKPTLAGLALQMYRTHYQPYHITYDKELTDKFFESYYGGRVECFKIGQTLSKKIDINSMYPYAMIEAVFPNPGYLKKEKNVSMKRLKYHFNFHEGLADITVNHKHFNFGFLPVRKDNKLLFPSGKFRGCWNFSEIKFALSKGIIEITDIHEVIYAPRMKSPFLNYVTELYDKRKASTGIDNMIYKLLLNTLYGKFAQREKFEEHYFESMPFDFIADLQEKKVNFEVCRFNDVRQDMYIKVECRHKSRFHTIALFSSYITSFARIHLLQAMLDKQKNIITYLDTDCIALEKLINFEDSNELGGFKLELDEITEIYGNKSYEYLKNSIKGKKLKGVPKGAIEISKNNFQIKKLIKTKEAIRRNIINGMPVTVNKKLTFNYDKRKIKNSGFTQILRFD